MERNLHLKKLIDRLKFNYVERSECFSSSANYNSIYLGLSVVSKLLAHFCACCNIPGSARPSTLTNRLKPFWNVLSQQNSLFCQSRAKRIVRQHLRFTEELHLSITKHVHKLYLKSLLIYGFLYSVKKKKVHEISVLLEHSICGDLNLCYQTRVTKILL